MVNSKDIVRILKKHRVVLYATSIVLFAIFLINTNVFASCDGIGGSCSYSNATMGCTNYEYNTVCANQASAACGCGYNNLTCQRSCDYHSEENSSCGGGSPYCCVPTGSLACGYNCNSCCTPNCSGKTCGDNGCGGSCGSCSSGYHCSNYQCVADDLLTNRTCTSRSGSVKASYITELRSWINTARTQASMSNYSWTDSTLTGVSVKTSHMSQMCTAITELKTNRGYTGAGACPGSYTSIKSSDINTLCQFLANITNAY